MSKASAESIQRLQAFIDSLPEESKSKCALCNTTLTHIIKQAEVEAGVGTATATRVLAKKINETAAPGDKVSGEALRQRVIGHTTDKNLSVRNEQIKKPRPTRSIEPGLLGEEMTAKITASFGETTILFRQAHMVMIGEIKELISNGWTGMSRETAVAEIEKILTLAKHGGVKPC